MKKNFTNTPPSFDNFKSKTNTYTFNKAANDTIDKVFQIELGTITDAEGDDYSVKFDA